MYTQPAYAAFEWDRSGRQHILFAAAEDAGLAQRLYAWPPVGELTVLNVEIAPGTPNCWNDAALPPAARQHVAAHLDAALQTLDTLLGQSDMSARLYAVGDEHAIWRAIRVADRHGMSPPAIRRHRVATLARPVFCVHCRHVAEHVRHNVFDCPGCHRALFVRDHFSRRLGAYMGFQIDAEVPGERPPIEEIYR